MLRAALLILPPDSRLNAPLSEITLTREDRYRRRMAMTADDGTAFLLDLPQATYLPGGAGLLLDDGR